MGKALVTPKGRRWIMFCREKYKLPYPFKEPDKQLLKSCAIWHIKQMPFF